MLERLVEEKWCFFCVMIDVAALLFLKGLLDQLGASWQVSAAAFAVVAAVGLYFWLAVEQAKLFGLMAVVGSAGLAWTLVAEFLKGWYGIAAFAALAVAFSLLQHYGHDNWLGYGRMPS